MFRWVGFLARIQAVWPYLWEAPHFMILGDKKKKKKNLESGRIQSLIWQSFLPRSIRGQSAIGRQARIPNTHPVNGNHTRTQTRDILYLPVTLWRGRSHRKIATGLYSEYATSKGELSFSKIKPFCLQTYCFCQKEFFYFRCFGKTAESSGLGPKTLKCCNPKPLAVTKTCLQAESFRCGVFALFCLGICLFACFVPKGFLCIFPEPESRSLHSIGDVGPKPPVPQFVILYSSRQKQTNKQTHSH